MNPRLPFRALGPAICPRGPPRTSPAWPRYGFCHRRCSGTAQGAVVTAKPGHGLPMAWANRLSTLWREDVPGRFPNAVLDDVTSSHDVGGMFSRITLRELTMLRFMNIVTDKPGWTEKVYDPTIVQKWRSEALNDGPAFELEMTERMFDYCVQELKFVAQHHSKSPNGAIQVFHIDAGVYKSDTAVPHHTKVALQRAVRALEDVPGEEKDWHPGSGGKVLDLVHPSLFPLVYGRTRVLPLGSRTANLDDCIERSGEGEVIDIPTDSAASQEALAYNDTDKAEYDEAAWSRQFQWLPAEVNISGDKPRVLTYINNLHPRRHKELYDLIEDVIGASIPLWDLTLAPCASCFHPAPRRITYDDCLYDPDPEKHTPEPEMELSETHEAYEGRIEAYWGWIKRTRKVILPEPPEKFKPLPQPNSFSLKESYGKKPLQIIVKLASIELTPERPEYEGGTWHVEGKMNEAIAASALYYYSLENITTSTLAFRQFSRDFYHGDVSYEQDHHDWLPAVFGLENEGSLIQNIGDVVTSEGRLITFPNILHHQVQPFRLADLTKPGHRKLLALFLVDPNINVISTADVPCQRADWVEEMRVSVEGPAKLGDEDHRECTMTLNEAKEYREALMEERKEFILVHQKWTQDGGGISLCEH